MQEDQERNEDLERKKEIYGKLRNGEFDAVEDAALALLDRNLSDADGELFLKISKFWKNRLELFEYSEENGEKLFREWDVFLDFCVQNRLENRKAVLSVKEFVFTNVVDTLIEAFRSSPLPSVETLVMLGQAFYEIGVSDRAIETLEYAQSLARDEGDARICLLLGNLYAEKGDGSLAMVMFNDAFLRFPQQVDLDSVDFPPVEKIRGMVEKDGFVDNEVAEWVPVYGYFYNALTVKRSIDYREYEELRRKLTDYEKSLKVDRKVVGIIIPRLVNYYLWMFDYHFYQVSAFGSCRNIVRRIDELLESLPLRPSQDELVKRKLRDRAFQVFSNILAGSSEKSNTKE
jgi:tetratricopeptide (TPR) repeat protein